MNKKQWILSVIAAVLFCLGLLIMLFVSVFSLPPVADLLNPPTETEDPAISITADPSESEETASPSESETEPEPVEITAPAPSYDITPPAQLGMTATTAFVYDIDTSRMVYAGGNPDAKLAPASLTKLLTAYTAEQFMDMNMIVTVGEEVLWIDPESSIAMLRPGHQLTVKMLIQGMMLPSGNDAAYAIAVAGGRVLSGNANMDRHTALNVFVSEMNEQARRLGMINSQFKNPDGIDATGHYSTVKDLITLSKAVLDSPLIMECAATAKLDVTLLSGETITWLNSNYLLQEESEYYTPNCIGLKTGSTQNAGKCVITLFRQDDGSYLLVGVLGSATDGQRFADTLILYKKFG